jgi:hypothetical protein
MKILLLLCVCLLVLSCNNEKQKTTEITSAAKDTNASAVTSQPEQVKAEEQLPIVDTGQTWFRVKITKNDSAYLDYEGSWPVFFLYGNSGTLQLIKSKALMSVSDGVTIYMNGMPTGKVAVVPSNREKGTASMIFMPVTDGAYGLAITSDEGFLNITKNVDSVVNGNFEARGKDLNNDNFVFKGYFINTKINPEKL